MVKIDIGKNKWERKVRIGNNKNIVKNGKINSNFDLIILYILITIVMNSYKGSKKNPTLFFSENNITLDNKNYILRDL